MMRRILAIVAVLLALSTQVWASRKARSSAKHAPTLTPASGASPHGGSTSAVATRQQRRARQRQQKPPVKSLFHGLDGSRRYSISVADNADLAGKLALGYSAIALTILRAIMPSRIPPIPSRPATFKATVSMGPLLMASREEFSLWTTSDASRKDFSSAATSTSTPSSTAAPSVLTDRFFYEPNADILNPYCVLYGLRALNGVMLALYEDGKVVATKSADPFKQVLRELQALPTMSLLLDALIKDPTYQRPAFLVNDIAFETNVGAPADHARTIVVAFWTEALYETLYSLSLALFRLLLLPAHPSATSPPAWDEGFGVECVRLLAMRCAALREAQMVPALRKYLSALRIQRRRNIPTFTLSLAELSGAYRVGIELISTWPFLPCFQQLSLDEEREKIEGEEEKNDDTPPNPESRRERSHELGLAWWIRQWQHLLFPSSDQDRVFISFTEWHRQEYSERYAPWLPSASTMRKLYEADLARWTSTTTTTPCEQSVLDDALVKSAHRFLLTWHQCIMLDMQYLHDLQRELAFVPFLSAILRQIALRLAKVFDLLARLLVQSPSFSQVSLRDVQSLSSVLFGAINECDTARRVPSEVTERPVFEDFSLACPVSPAADASTDEYVRSELRRLRWQHMAVRSAFHLLAATHEPIATSSTSSTSSPTSSSSLAQASCMPNAVKALRRVDTLWTGMLMAHRRDDPFRQALWLWGLTALTSKGEHSPSSAVFHRQPMGGNALAILKCLDEALLVLSPDAILKVPFGMLLPGLDEEDDSLRRAYVAWGWRHGLPSYFIEQGIDALFDECEDDGKREEEDDDDDDGTQYDDDDEEFFSGEVIDADADTADESSDADS